MLARLNSRIRSSAEAGFTLIELLIVVVILGVLAGIVVFAVGGITDRGKTSACSTEKKTIQTAEEAYYAKNGSYTTSGNLVPGFLADAPVSYTAAVSGSTYTISPVSGNANGCT